MPRVINRIKKRDDRLKNMQMLHSAASYLFRSPPSQYAARKITSRTLRKQFGQPVEQSQGVRNVIPLILHNHLEIGIREPPYGVRVVGLPGGAGKTTHTRIVCERLRKAGEISGVCAVVGGAIARASSGPALQLAISEYVVGPSIKTLLKDTSMDMDMISDYLTSVAKDGERPIVLVIDQFDHIMRNNEHNSVYSLVTGLAEDSVQTMKYVVVIGVSDPSHAATILRWNGGSKIHGLGHNSSTYKWGEDSIRTLMNEYSGVVPPDWFYKCAVRAGTPGYVVECMKELSVNNTNESYFHQKCAQVESQWRKWEDVPR